MVMGSTHHLTEMSTKNLRGVKRGRRVMPTSSPPCVKCFPRWCGSLDVSQPYGPLRSVTGILTVVCCTVLAKWTRLTEIVTYIWKLLKEFGLSSALFVCTKIVVEIPNLGTCGFTIVSVLPQKLKVTPCDSALTLWNWALLERPPIV
jgi:hypothetical protein